METPILVLLKTNYPRAEHDVMTTQQYGEQGQEVGPTRREGQKSPWCWQGIGAWGGQPDSNV